MPEKQEMLKKQLVRNAMRISAFLFYFNNTPVDSVAVFPLALSQNSEDFFMNQLSFLNVIFKCVSLQAAIDAALADAKSSTEVGFASPDKDHSFTSCPQF